MDEQDLQNSFDSAFDNSIEVADEGTPVTDEPQQPVEAALEETVIEEPQGPSELELLRQEFADQLRQTNDKLHGKIGELNRYILELKQQPKTAPPRQISTESLKNFREEFGDDAAAKLAQDLSELSLSSNTVDYSEKLDEIKREHALQLVTSAHRDWRRINDSTEFEEFKNQLNQEDRDRLNTTWNPVEIIDSISAFKERRSLTQLDNFNEWRESLLNAEVKDQLSKSLDPEFYQEAKEALIEWNKQRDAALKQQQQEKRQATKDALSRLLRRQAPESLTRE
jgi:hypothetical protein